MHYLGRLSNKDETAILYNKKQTLFLQIFGLVAFIEQKENDNNDVFFLLDKGHEAENLQKECLFLLHYHFPMEDSSESCDFIRRPNRTTGIFCSNLVNYRNCIKSGVDFHIIPMMTI